MTPFYKPYLGGTELVLEQLSIGLAQQLGANNVATLTSRYAFPWKKQPGLPARELSDPGGVLVDRTAVLYSMATKTHPEAEPLNNPLAIYQLVRHFQPTIVHWIGGGWHSAKAMALKFTAGQANAVWSPLYIPTAAPESGRQPASRKLAQLASAVTFQTEHERKAYASQWGIWPGSMHQLQPGNDRLPLKSRTMAGTQVVICVGRIGRHKGQLELVKQWSRIKPYLKSPARLVLIGEDEGLADGTAAIEAFVAQHGLVNDVTLTGWQNENQLADWYAQASLLVSMSKIESFGIGYCEAMRIGVPVLAWDVGPIREVVRNGGLVISRPPHTSDDFGDAMIRILADNASRQRLADQALTVGRERTWQATVAAALEVYETVRGRARERST